MEHVRINASKTLSRSPMHVNAYSTFTHRETHCNTCKRGNPFRRCLASLSQKLMVPSDPAVQKVPYCFGFSERDSGDAIMSVSAHVQVFIHKYAYASIHVGHVHPHQCLCKQLAWTGSTGGTHACVHQECICMHKHTRTCL
jgi:hypothetical protein